MICEKFSSKFFSSSLIVFHIHIAILLLSLAVTSINTYESHSHSHSSSFHSFERNQLPDFRYNDARIDAITHLPNNTLIVVSNGFYWVLREGQLPRGYNVRGKVSDLHPKFTRIDAIFCDPSYNDMDPKIYIMEYTNRNGLMVACQEFNGPFKMDNKYCNLPVDQRWTTVLRDLDLKSPIDAAIWRNRSRDREGGFWTFYQGQKFTVIDPFKMELRFTYDTPQWMGFNETVTAAYYDYKKYQFYLFHEHNSYHIWTVNVSLMRTLPMGWDRAYLHGSLSPKLTINRDFFRYHLSELFNYDQPNLVRNEFIPEKEGEETEQEKNENEMLNGNEPIIDSYNEVKDEQHTDSSNSIDRAKVVPNSDNNEIKENRGSESERRNGYDPNNNNQQNIKTFTRKGIVEDSGSGIASHNHNDNQAINIHLSDDSQSFHSTNTLESSGGQRTRPSSVSLAYLVFYLTNVIIVPLLLCFNQM